MRKLIITDMKVRDIACTVTAVWEENQVVELHLYPENRKEILGNIYVGRVENIAENIQAAFVRIEKDTIGYLPLSDLCSPIYANPKKQSGLRQGDELLVQVNREKIKSKAPCVTTSLNFTGKYMVLTTDRKGVGVSSKLDKESKKRLKSWFTPLCGETFGIIVRTNAKDAAEEELLDELSYLKKRLARILQFGPSRMGCSLVEKAPCGYLQDIRDIYGTGLDAIITDSPKQYDSIKAYLEQYQPKDQHLLTLYQDPLLPLLKLYRLETALSHACKEKIWLSSGGYLVIQQTEAFAAIDVNTGKFTGKKKAEETFRKINLEAVGEIARQLRLRNLSGIILIDFINLSNPDHEEELLHILQRTLRQDPVKTTVVDMTALKIVEVTRKKVRKSLAEEIGDIANDSF